MLRVKKLFVLVLTLTLGRVASADISGAALVGDGDTITISGNKISLHKGSKNMENQEENEDDFAKMFYANISDYLRNVHRLEVKDVSQRGTGAYRMSEEEHQSDATADIAHAMLSYLANGTCGDCLQSLTDYGGKHGDHYDAMLMEVF